MRRVDGSERDKEGNDFLSDRSHPRSGPEQRKKKSHNTKTPGRQSKKSLWPSHLDLQHLEQETKKERRLANVAVGAAEIGMDLVGVCRFGT